ncbi:MAG: SGNH/GDSL hydrolase family protein [Eubacteriales bacterium]
MIFENGDRIVFAGDSVTDMGSVNPVGEGHREDPLGRSYVRVIENLLISCYPERLIRVTNSGISGNTSKDLLARFDRDVVSLNPAWVSICIGINDVWRQFDLPEFPEHHVSPEDYEANLKQMLDALSGRVKGVFLCTPYIMEPEKGDRMRRRMDEYGEICKKLAAARGCVLVDFQSLYDRFFAYRHSALIAWDRIHPNQIGATLMAREFLSKCGFDYNRAYPAVN